MKSSLSLSVAMLLSASSPALAGGAPEPGDPDTTFGNGTGRTKIGFESLGATKDTPSGIGLDSLGRIVVSGTAASNNGPKMVLARLDANGNEDLSFGYGDTLGDYKIVYPNLSSPSIREGYALVMADDAPCVVGASVDVTGSTASSACFSPVRAHTANPPAATPLWTAVTPTAAQFLTDHFFYAIGTSGAGANEAMQVVRMRLSGADLAADTTFSNDGYWDIGFFDATSHGTAAAIAPDLGVYAVGYVHYLASGHECFVATKIAPNGALDNTFGGSRFVAFDSIGYTDAHPVAVLVDGEDRLVIVGTAKSKQDPADTEIAVARLLPNGKPDESFDSDGTAVFSFNAVDPTFDDVPNAVVLDDLGRIYVVGTAHLTKDNVPVDQSEIAIIRLLPNGTLDTSFGNFGRYDYSFSACNDKADRGIAAVMQNNKLLILGETTPCPGVAEDTDFVVFRITIGDDIFFDGFEEQ